MSSLTHKSKPLSHPESREEGRGRRKERKRAGARKDELYNLKDDPAETTNVASANADRAAAMKKLLVQSRDRGYTRPSAGK